MSKSLLKRLGLLLTLMAFIVACGGDTAVEDAVDAVGDATGEAVDAKQ